MLAIAHTGMRKMRTCGIAYRLTAARPTDYIVYGYTCINRVMIKLSIRVRVSFTTAMRIACPYLHWINSNPNTDPNLNLDPSVPVY